MQNINKDESILFVHVSSDEPLLQAVTVEHFKYTHIPQ